jgi:hypothetical protein
MSRHNADSNNPPTTSGTTVCAEDVAELRFVNQAAYDQFANWLDGELALLEARFADYLTTVSQRASRPKRSS